MSKYVPLRDFLASQDQDYILMTFGEIERILGFGLPASKKYPAWWSNNPSNNPMTREWLDAGFETESVNTADGKLVFRKIRKATSGGGADGCRPVSPRPRYQGFGFMKGQITFAPGFDPTKPFSDEPWDQGYLGEDRL